MKVKIIAYTPEPEKIIASAAKLCYSPVGIDKIQEKLTDDNIEHFINHLISIGHESPLEHCTFSFAIEGISRACSHQLVRHRLASFSQQSQRYVNMSNAEYITPPSIANDEDLRERYEEYMDNCFREYTYLTELLVSNILQDEYYLKYRECKKLADDNNTAEMIFKEEYPYIYNKVEKQAMEDARYVLPNACETKLVMTMNIRELLHFFSIRCCNRAQWEIRELADEMLRQCKEIAPLLFKNAGPSCVFGKCKEGNMYCGSPRRNEP